MNFTDFENIMRAKGLATLADIARDLDTTPQAVSNWKSRDQVPYHIVALISRLEDNNFYTEEKITSKSSGNISHFSRNNNSEINIGDLLLTIAQQIKIIAFCFMVSVFISFTYNWSNNEIYYESKSKILLPQDTGSTSSGMGGLASQFGVSLSQDASAADLSSPVLFPEMIKTHSFTEKILLDTFKYEGDDRYRTLFEILTIDQVAEKNSELVKINAKEKFSSMVSLVKLGMFYELVVKASDPLLARDINIKVLDNLQLQSKQYKNKNVIERIDFIQSRIKVVEGDLTGSEKKLKIFLEKNRQVSSPSLILEQERLSREVEIQKAVFLTLKQQLELSNIEKIQTQSIIQILDPPQVPVNGSGKNLKLITIMGGLMGLVIGLIFAFIKSLISNANTEQKRKIRRIKIFTKKKCKDFILDRRITGFTSMMMIFSLPFYLSHESVSPKYFGKYSSNLFFLIVAYIIVMLFFVSSFFLSKKNSRKSQSL